MTLALGLLNYRGFYPYKMKTGVNSSSQVKLLQLYIQFLLLSEIAHLQASRTRALCQCKRRRKLDSQGHIYTTLFFGFDSFFLFKKKFSALLLYSIG